MRRKREMAAEFPVCTVVGRHGLIFRGESNFRKAREKAGDSCGLLMTLAIACAVSGLSLRLRLMQEPAMTGKEYPPPVIIQVEELSKPGRSPVRRRARLACCAGLFSALVVLAISAVGLCLMQQVELQPKFVEVQPSATSAGAVEISVGVRFSGFPAMHRIELDTAHCSLQGSNLTALAKKMASVSLLKPMSVSDGDTIVAARAGLSIDAVAALRATLKQFATRDPDANSHVRCAASGKVTSGALHVSVAMEHTFHATMLPADESNDGSWQVCTYWHTRYWPALTSCSPLLPLA